MNVFMSLNAGAGSDLRRGLVIIMQPVLSCSAAVTFASLLSALERHSLPPSAGPKPSYTSGLWNQEPNKLLLLISDTVPGILLQ